jgi:type IV fimbrial biogenesis protein FimT
MSESLAQTHRPFSLGFTMIELMITLSIVAILVGLAAPSLRETIMNIRITGQTNDLMSDLAFARSEAAKRNVPVVVCPSADGETCSAGAWNQGWLVYPDTNVSGTKQANDDEKALKNRRALEGPNTLTLTCAPSADSVTYRPTGTTGSPSAIFTLCDTRTTVNAGRTIAINATGRAISARVTCPITPACP